MTRDELLAGLRALKAEEEAKWSAYFGGKPNPRPGRDEVDWHIAADDLLLKFINDPEIEEAFANVSKLYE